MDIDADYARREALLHHAQDIVVETRERLLNEGIHPLSVTLAFFLSGLGPVAISHLDNEEKLMVCKMLENFVSDTKECIAEWRN